MKDLRFFNELLMWLVFFALLPALVTPRRGRSAAGFIFLEPGDTETAALGCKAAAIGGPISSTNVYPHPGMIIAVPVW